jgi:formate C-acetyltransferase
VWNKLTEMFKEEQAKGVYDAETKLPQEIDTYGPGYIDKDNEVIVGLQTDAPLKRGIFPKGGIRMVENSLTAYGYELDPLTKDIYTRYRKTHNEGVFSAYNDEILAARKSGIITGLPDAYGRGRIIGDYRRVPLYGTAILIKERKAFQKQLDIQEFNENVIRSREEVTDQIKALQKFEKMCQSYGFDVSQPARNAHEAVQFLYLAYLAAVKDQDGAAMSIGRTSTFLDIYIEKDLKEGVITESEAQELIDQMIIKLRIVRFLRTPEYNELFSGDPVWVTESLGGQNIEGKTLVTRTSFRYLHTLYNLGPAPEPNLTVLWSQSAPENWKKFCAKVSVETSAIQYENDDLMRPDYGDDYGIACCVSPMRIGKQMQLFGARANLAKCLLYAINGGVDEKSGVQVAPKFEAITSEYLDYDEVMEKFEQTMRWLAKVYVNALKIIHYMHDKYAYEAFEMALHDGNVQRIMATGIAGLSIVADSLAAIRDTKVKVIRDERGIAVDFEREGDYVPFGNNDDRTDQIAVDIVKKFMGYLRQHETYRNAITSQSILTITSNVVYGKKTGSTPDGRPAGTPFAPGANPMNGRDSKGAVAALASVAKLPFQHAHDGISYTFAVSPGSLGKDTDMRVNNMVNLLDGYFTADGGQHLNVNVFDKDLLLDAMDHPEKYPQLTIRVSGYAVNFIKLTREQQLDVISRTINQSL